MIILPSEDTLLDRLADCHEEPLVVAEVARVLGKHAGQQRHVGDIPLLVELAFGEVVKGKHAALAHMILAMVSRQPFINAVEGVRCS